MAFYKWDEVKELELDSGVTRRVVSGDKLMIFRNFLPKGSVPPRHRHENEQVAYVVSGAVKFWLGDEERIMRALARETGLPFVKIDPLKLDAQLVTSVISRPFARRHLVVPLDRVFEVPVRVEVLHTQCRVLRDRLRPHMRLAARVVVDGVVGEVASDVVGVAGIQRLVVRPDVVEPRSHQVDPFTDPARSGTDAMAQCAYEPFG